MAKWVDAPYIMELFYILLVLLVFTRLMGEVAVRFRQPALVGELVAGIGLGMMVNHFQQTFPVLSGLTKDTVFRAITDLGVFFLMLHAGLEMRPKDLVKASSRSLLVAVSGLLLPLGAGFAVAWMFSAIVIVAVTTTLAVPILLRLLMNTNRKGAPHHPSPHET